ncbi:HNH endonuclease [Pedobacter ghigonis]|uniref:HNH endonuclease n=1 Tax=Pedobacter ghigonis TaxID=2730403 RepID=UPI00158B0438|nr:hypothetical protein [Pedobacter ghigonis]
MIFLEKNNQAAIDHISQFLKANWLVSASGAYKYINIGYRDIKRGGFRSYFVLEQNYICCYCSRKIVDDHTCELEHVIPRSVTQIVDLSKYYDLSDTLKNNVVLQSDFENAIIEKDSPPFPHHIAYHNIVASCNGRTFETSASFTCCNRERADDFVPPFNLIKDVIAYLPDGTIVYGTNPQERSYFEILNLNKKILIDIRRLWYLFSLSNLSQEKITSEEITNLKEHIVENAISHSTTTIEDIKVLLPQFINPELWKLFKEYSYFLSYYRTLAA